VTLRPKSRRYGNVCERAIRVLDERSGTRNSLLLENERGVMPVEVRPIRARAKPGIVI
jgi:hypothetical protein